MGLDCTKKETDARLHFFYGSHALFMGPASTDFSKFFFKIGSYSTIHTFINYFVTVFSVFSNKRYPNRPKVPILPQLLIIKLNLKYPPKNLKKFKMSLCL